MQRWGVVVSMEDCEEGLQRGEDVELNPERDGFRDDGVQMTMVLLGYQFPSRVIGVGSIWQQGQH